MDIEIKVFSEGDTLSPDATFAAVAPTGSGWALLWPDRAAGAVEQTFLPGSQGQSPETAVVMARSFIKANNKRLTKP